MVKLQEWLDSLQQWWFELMWQSSPERKELAKNRLAAHEQAMKEGRDSPYTHPEKFNFL